MPNLSLSHPTPTFQTCGWLFSHPHHWYMPLWKATNWLCITNKLINSVPTGNKKSSPSINSQHIAINNTICGTTWRCMTSHRQLQLSTTQRFKKFMQIRHLAFELRAFSYFSRQTTLKINEFRGHYPRRQPLMKMHKSKKRLFKWAHTASSYLHFDTFRGTWPWTWPSRSMYFVVMLSSKVALMKAHKAKQRSSKFDHSCSSYLHICTFPGGWPSNLPSRAMNFAVTFILKTALMKAHKLKRRPPKSDYICSSYLCFCTFRLRTWNLTLNLNEFRGHLFPKR